MRFKEGSKVGKHLGCPCKPKGVMVITKVTERTGREIKFRERCNACGLERDGELSFIL